MRKPLRASGCNGRPLGRCLQHALAYQCFVKLHAHLACQVVVAHARAAQRRLPGAGAQPHGTGAKRHVHQRLQQVGYIPVRQPEVAVPALALHGDQARIQQLGEVGADGLLGHACNVGQLGGRERAVRHQCGEDFGACAVADERGNARNVGAVFHGSILGEPLSAVNRLS